MLLQVQHDPKSKGVIEDIWNSGEVVPRVHEVESTSEVQRWIYAQVNCYLISLSRQPVACV